MKLLLTMLLFFYANVLFGARLEWNANDPSEQVLGYKVYYSQIQGQWDAVVDVGNKTTWPIPDDWPVGNHYWFAVTAYADLGLESDFSETVDYTIPIKLWITREGIKAHVNPSQNYLLEGTTDFVSWLGVEAKTSETDWLEFIPPRDESFKFFRLKKLEAAPMIAMASAQMSMEKGLLVSVTEANTIQTKEKLSRKVKRFFKYRAGMHPSYRKGSEVLMDVSQKQKKTDISPPMPVRLK